MGGLGERERGGEGVVLLVDMIDDDRRRRWMWEGGDEDGEG